MVYGLNGESARERREGFSLFGRLGAGVLDNSADGIEYERVNDFHLVAGVGVEYGFENGLAARGELVSHDVDARYAQLGLVYRFGEPFRSTARRGPRPAEPRPLPSESLDTRRSASSPPPADPASPPASRSEEPITLPELDALPDPDAVATPVPAPAPIPALEPLPEPESTRAPVTASARDGDADGLPDSRDRCLDTPPNRPIAADGCELLDGVLDGVGFEPGSDRLRAGSAPVLDMIASALREYPLIDVTIDAHTDNEGSAESNLELSRRRAITVARALVAGGVAPARLKPRAFGESRPLASNATAEGRARNRRVELSVID